MRVGVRLQEQVGPHVDEEFAADPIAERSDPRDLVWRCRGAVGADHLVLEIAADRAGLGEAPRRWPSMPSASIA